ncbi:MAG: hypothetical protein MUP28_10985 [Candidatus Aminicenantes bacterium]|nr:hypothetical protein [Candidatus Aminicenantes bacterium]
MKKGVVIIMAFAMAVLGTVQAFAQFTPEELAEHPKWEEFLRTAEIIKQDQLRGDQAVTSPWQLTLKSGDVVRDALWKNPVGKMAGYLEGWQYEIAAYLLDKYLGLNMVPPTIERRFHEDRGSIQLWIPDCITLKQKTEQKIKTPPVKIFNWNRCTYLQRAWDNLIANEDRHMNQILLTKDWRMILIDHSRSFRSSKKFTQELIYTEKHREGPKLMSELPRAFVEKVKALTFEGIKPVVGECLTDEEINAVLVRRVLILAEIDRLVQKNGEDKVLY